jgi:hypothetical protein
MLSFIRNIHHDRTQDLGTTLAAEIDRLGFRSALVVEKSTALAGLEARGY